jgi:hypothetical protein
LQRGAFLQARPRGLRTIDVIVIREVAVTPVFWLGMTFALSLWAAFMLLLHWLQ